MLEGLAIEGVIVLEFPTVEAFALINARHRVNRQQHKFAPRRRPAVQQSAPHDPGRTWHKPKRNSGSFPTTVWQIDLPVLPGVESRHPTEKPLELFATPIMLHTQPGDLCYEPFSGSGTHLCAAEKTGRRCFAMEIEPAFVAVALERLSDMGLKPKLVSS
jgi:DNA modification methylase